MLALQNALGIALEHPESSRFRICTIQQSLYGYFTALSMTSVFNKKTELLPILSNEKGVTPLQLRVCLKQHLFLFQQVANLSQ